MKLHHPCLSDLFTREQENQLAVLLAELMAYGYGSVEILIAEGKLRFFSYKRSIKASPVADQHDDQPGFTKNPSKMPLGAGRKPQDG